MTALGAFRIGEDDGPWWVLNRRRQRPLVLFESEKTTAIGGFQIGEDDGHWWLSNRRRRRVVFDMTRYELNSGPLDPSVLTLQGKHRSKDIWYGKVNMQVIARHADGKFWGLVMRHGIDSRVLQIIEDAGLLGLYRASRVTLDLSLLTALIERWRPETHTFHFRTGEVTITLQDVEILYGLPVEGNPIIQNEVNRSIEDWQALCYRLLGFVPNARHLDGSRLNTKSIFKYMDKLPKLSPYATTSVIHQYARCYIFWMICGMLFPDTSGSKLKMMYLDLLEDVDKIPSFSWGGAAFVCLYRGMCKAACDSNTEIAGFLPLLQIWAWERIPPIRPNILMHRSETHLAGHIEILDVEGPRAYNWRAYFSWADVSHYTLSVYRDTFDSMSDDQFVWEPYTRDIMTRLPVYCYAGQAIWRSTVPLICWDVVEIHQPDRVLRQFGLEQDVPLATDFPLDHYRHDRRGRRERDWLRIHASYINQWNDRHQQVIYYPPATRPLQYGHPYLRWYRQISRLIINNPAHRQIEGYMPNAATHESVEPFPSALSPCPQWQMPMEEYCHFHQNLQQ